MRTEKEYESGHLDNSIFFPVTKFINMAEGIALSEEETKKLMEDAGIDLSKNTIYSCNAGIAATPGYFRTKGFMTGELSVYDGSFSEWKKAHPQA